MSRFHTLSYKLIYVYRINDEQHKGCLKIGETLCKKGYWGIKPNSKELNDSAHERIKASTQTAAISYELLYTELAAFERNGGMYVFSDTDVHQVLLRSNIKRHKFGSNIKALEWFDTDLATVIKAIEAVKTGKEALDHKEINNNESTPEIVLRPEQREAIESTKKQFKKSSQMLWNAKMRFGKTLSALQLVKEQQYQRTLILTHRPVVNAGWFEDFGKIFNNKDKSTVPYAYGSKKTGDSFSSLENRARSKESLHYVYFASMQDLRGSELVGGKFDKNDEIFSVQWDLLIIDEAHEGTQTQLGQAVIQELTDNGQDTKVLRLSGTPFNLLHDFKENEIYTWDYVMEQRAKNEWDLLHPGDHNPYSDLPQLNIFTYDLGNELPKFIDNDVAFNFREFFRVNEQGKLVHHYDVVAFLNLLTAPQGTGNKEQSYPFANKEYQQTFNHTLWVLPGVKAAHAVAKLLQEHPVFQHFQIVDVAGSGDDIGEFDDAEDESLFSEQTRHLDALEAVKSAIGPTPETTRTITLTCGRLTTGVSVGAWTAVLMLAGSYKTAASSYMQTIFRVQTPATINGQVKEQCYVFDFAPDRTLKVLAETAKISAQAGKTQESDRKIMGEFLNFCPVIAIHGSQMSKLNVDSMLEQLKRVYVERVVAHGFEDDTLYNDELLKLSNVDLDEFNKLKGIIGTTKAMPRSNEVDINLQGLSDEEYDEASKASKKKKSKKELTEEELKALEALKEAKKNRDAAISILRGISIRMPLLIFGAELQYELDFGLHIDNEDTPSNREDYVESDSAEDMNYITLNNFTEIIDDQSWQEFMPEGVTKEIFKKFKKYYDPDIFRAAGKRIRSMARNADNVSIEERIDRIASLFATFRNPDKETVLTPWRVVNMHLGDCFGGYNFFDKKYEHSISTPRHINSKIARSVFNPESKILEINSKSGLYPLYAAYSIYRSYISERGLSADSIEQQQSIWDEVLARNIFVICKTPMAQSITKRTLLGCRKAKINAKFYDNLIDEIKDNTQPFINRIKRGQTFWQANYDNDMKFNAIVGNPPYQTSSNDTRSTSRDTPVYQLFVQACKQMPAQYVSLIIPARWMATGLGLNAFREQMLSDKHLQKLFDYPATKDVFSNVDIKGGVCYFLRSQKHQGLCEVVTTRNNERSQPTMRQLDGFDIFVRSPIALTILKKVIAEQQKGSSQSSDEGAGAAKPQSMMEILSVDKEFGWTSNFRDFRQVDASGAAKAKGNEVPIFYNEKGKRYVGYIERTEIKKSTHLIDTYKVMIPNAGSDGGQRIPDRVLSTPFIAPNPSVCTQTYLFLYTNNQEHCANMLKYVHTKFFRFLISLRKITQHATRDTYKWVPYQNFGKDSDIDWDQNTENIDQQLYRKYQLCTEEIAYIEMMIKAM